jgi:hypothetical protein
VTKTEQSQAEAFKQAARELECDESEEAFRRNLRAIAKAPVEKPQRKVK